ncbi:MAG TPA: Calx-beta domain-containing protein, partial [Sedimentisphaerales bacterium]|nr:Calx-beta domain-containing protein [Sedimentisphaerales bacterium]
MVVRKCLTIVTAGIIFCVAGAAYSESQVNPVSQPSDDAEESANGSVSLTSSDLELVQDNNIQTIGIRFRGVNIRQGARVTKAYVQFTCDETRNLNPCELVIQGQAADDAATFATSPRNVSSRNRTGTSVNWSPPNWSRVGDAGPDQRTPDLSQIVQEIVSRDGWVQGNALAIIITGMGTRVAQAYGGAPAVLHLEWSTHDCVVGFAQAEGSGPEDGRTISINVYLSPQISAATVTVDYAVMDITTDSSDYTPHPASGRLSFPPGTGSQAIRITPRADTEPEGDEQFKVSLSNPSGAGLDVALGTVVEHIYTIIDSSPKVMFLEPSSSGDESAGLVSMGVWISTPSTQTVTVDYAVKAESTTAQSPADYTLLGSGTLTFPPGSSQQSINLMILDDLVPERSEQIVLVLSNPTNASLGSPSEHVYTINASELAADWPMWRYDANRSGASPFTLSPILSLQWELRLPRLERAWPDQGNRIDYDRCYQPIVLGKTLFVGSSVTDSVTAYDTETGVVKWRFFADAPVRFAPAGWTDDPADPADDKVFVVSDDGCLYCLGAGDGSVIWKFLGAPSGKKGIGNKRLGSLWPARGGPTLLDDTVYFSAGIWPFMGVFVYALDAATGDCLWLNDGSGSIYMTQPHNADSFAALAPQGYLVAVGDRLIVPNGRANAAGLDRNTGQLLYCDLNSNNKNSTNHAAAYGDQFNNSGRLFNIADGSSVGSLEDGAIMSGAGSYTQTFCMAGDLLYKGAKGSVWATAFGGNLLWQASIAGTPASMLAADGRLLVVTEEGSIYCFGPKSVSNPPVISELMDRVGWPLEDAWTTAAENILATTGVNEGYCLVLG